MKYTDEQLNDPKFWDEHAPEGAQAIIDREWWAKWDGEKEFTWSETKQYWTASTLSWSMGKYVYNGFAVHERPTVDVRTYKCFKQVADVIGDERAAEELGRVENLNARGGLDGAFIWNDSPQGHGFWGKISSGINPYAEAPVEQATNVAAETLRAALGHMEDRAKTYDSKEGERSMGKTVSMFNTMYGLELSEEQGWAFMCLLKLVRTSQGDFRADNYEDLAAYAGLMCEGAKHE